MSDSPVQTYAQREELRLYQEAKARQENGEVSGAPSIAFELALVAVVAIILVAFIPLIRALPRPPAPIATCPPLEPGAVVIVTLSSDHKGTVQASCSTARGRTKVAP